MKINRVAITGMGMITGLGHTLEENWKNATAGKSGVSLIEQADTEQMLTKIAGEVKNFTIADHIMDPKEHARYDRFIHFAMHSAYEALNDAGLITNNEMNKTYDSHRMGAIMGVGIGGFPEIERTAHVLFDKGPKRVSPFFIPAVIPNMATGLMSIRFGLQGLNYTISSACASSAHALTAACYEIMFGRQDVMVSGGSEAVVGALGMSGFITMKALSRRNDEPHRASRPFDTGRDGFVLGEGAGILVLENYDKAVARGAKIYAEIIGHGATSDAYHITAPHPEGDGAYNSMKMAVENAGIKFSEVGYVNAHGTSTPLGDIGETRAIKRTFGEHSKNLLVSSTKSMTGHLLGAAGGIETIFCAMALHTGTIPPTINLENQDPECDLNYVPNIAVKADVKYALNNSFGFGGTNSSLVLKKV
ncbi:MAG: beta-ketoacyl-ACP synthase II [Bacteriovorax sp.]|jgi:3-oxoacyl-[acyl-carrier-protein] synthase II